MRLKLAIKAFVRAFKEPNKMKYFLEEKPLIPPSPSADRSHLRLLQALQQGGRLVDFLKEDLRAYSDAQVGAAVRKIHQDCAELVEELVTIRHLRDEPEGATIQVLKGYNPSELKIIGNIRGEPPYTGVLVHRGWKVHKQSLPKQTGEMSPEVICPAEIEVR